MPPSADNFRARRLSVSDIDTSEFDKAGASAGGSTPKGVAPRQRRLSLSPEMGTKTADVPFHKDKVYGTFSCHGVEPGQRQGETHAKINQDRGAVAFLAHSANYKNIAGCKEVLFCAYDGHGGNGDKVSQFVVDKIPELLTEEKDAFDTDDFSSIEKALQRAFLKCDRLLKENRIDAELSGTTAVVTLVRQYAGKSSLELYTAWTGDSRAVLWEDKPGAAFNKTNVFDLSDDHKPDTPKEMSRIKAAGGFVSPPEEEWGGPARVWLDQEMTLPGLAMARSLGDHLVKAVGVTAEPEVKHRSVDMSCGNEQYLILASDGVWEFIASHEAMKLVHKYKGDGMTAACTKLIESSAAKWRAEEGDYRDDITALCVALHEMITSQQWVNMYA